MTDWQPIETAPRDGIRILGARVGGLSAEIVQWGGSRPPCWRDFYGRRAWTQPTHWLPLPEPPTGALRSYLVGRSAAA